MHIHSLDVYRAGVSLWHRLDPRVKLALTLTYVLAVSLTPVGAWPAYVLFFALVLSAAVASELGVRFVLKRALLALPFVLAALPLLVMTPGRPLLSIPLGKWLLVLTLPGLERFLSIAVKSWLSVQMAVLLTATTTLPDLLLAMRALRIPELLVATIGLMWRYLFVLMDEAMRMMHAREARSAAGEGHSGGSVVWRARVTGGMAGSLFLRGYERSERIYNAMLARGYDGSIRSLPLRPMSVGERLILFVGLTLLAALVLLGRFLG